MFFLCTFCIILTIVFSLIADLGGLINAIGYIANDFFNSCLMQSRCNALLK